VLLREGANHSVYHNPAVQRTSTVPRHREVKNPTAIRICKQLAVPDPLPKQEWIRSFFEEFERKVNRLQELYDNSFQDEAFTLCMIYVDRLASGHFGGREGQNRKNFSKALTQLSGNPLFGMIHPLQLQRLTKRFCPSAASFIQSVAGKQPHFLLDEAKLAEEIRQSSLPGQEKAELISHLWRASMSNIAYDHVRGAEVHGPGSGGQPFGETIYDGKKGVVLDFDIFYGALKEILKKVTELSLSSDDWFGNPNYMKERQP